jgi:glycosyltransferase involved in cell wall biosynthesis
MMNGKIGHQAYQELTRRLQEIVRRELPPDATTLVASKGDDELMKLDGRRAWHFPQRDDGVYAGYYPSDSAAAIAHLKSLQEKGAEFLIFPRTAFWWLDHYDDFGQYLESNYRLLVHDKDTCKIFALRGRGSRQRDREDGAEPVVSHDYFKELGMSIRNDVSDGPIDNWGGPVAHRQIEEPEMNLRDYVREDLIDDLKMVFDPDYYGEQTGAHFSSFDAALIDYLEKGYLEGHNPHPLFDTTYYLAHYPKVKLSGANPLLYFLSQGVRQDHNPSPYFDTAFYYGHGHNFRENRINPLVHYLKGAAEGKACNPNPLFQNGYYLHNYPDVKNNGFNPLAHYVRYGCEEKRFVSRIHRDIVQELLRSAKNSLIRGKWRSGTVLLFSNGGPHSDAPVILETAEALADEYHLNPLVVLLHRPDIDPEFEATLNTVVLDDFRMACDVFRPSALHMLTKTLCSMQPLFTVCEIQDMLPVLRASRIPSFYLYPDLADLPSKDVLENVFRFADRVIFNSSSAFHSVGQAVGTYPTNVALRPRGLRSSTSSGARRREARERLIRGFESNEEPFVVLGGGPVAGSGGSDMFLAAAKMFRKRRPDANVAFVWVTETETGSSRRPDEFSQQGEIQKSGLEGVVSHMDEEGAIEQYLDAADVYFLPFREPPFPASTLNAMSGHVPVICFEGSTSVSSTSHNGELVVPYLDVEAVCEKLSLLHDNTLSKEQFAGNGSGELSIAADYAESLLELAKRDFRMPEEVGYRNGDGTQRTARRVVIPCGNWALSGVNSSLEAMGEELIRLGWDVEIVFTRDRETILQSVGLEENLPQIPYRYLQPNNPGIEGIWEGLIAHLEQTAPCIMFMGYDFVANGIAPALTDKVGAVAWVQADDSDYYEQTYRLGRYCNAVVCVSERVKKGVAELNPVIGDKAHVIHNSSINDHQIVGERPSPSEKMRLVYAGRLVHYQKRILDFVELAHSLDRVGIPYELTLIGNFVDRENIRPLFESEAKAYLEDGRIVLPGRMTREQILEEFRNHDLFILLSDFEGLPLSLIEAMASGCVPVVAEMESGVPEVITNGENGFTVSGRDYDQWATLLADLWRDPERHAQLSHQARETVRERFTVEQVGKQFDELFGRIADEIGSGGYRRPPCLKWPNDLAPTGDVLPPPTMYRPPMFGAHTRVNAFAVRKSDRERM